MWYYEHTDENDEDYDDFDEILTQDKVHNSCPKECDIKIMNRLV